MMTNNIFQKVFILIFCILLGIHSYAQSKLINAGKVEKVIDAVQPVEKKEKATPTKKPKKETPAIPDNKYKSVGYMEITGISFGSTDYLGNLVDDFGAELYAGNLKYLVPKVFYKGLANSSKEISLDIKIISEDGTMKRGKDSPDGYTYTTKVKVYPGDGQSMKLVGYGNNYCTFYSAGRYSYEIWYDGNILFQKGIRIYEGTVPVVNSKLIKINGFQFCNVTKKSEMISGYGEELVAKEIQFISSQISYEGLSSNEKQATFMIRIIEPSGNMLTGKDSPVGYTLKYDMVIKPGHCKGTIIGWGSENHSMYVAGQYKYEVWLNGDKICETTFIVKSEKTVTNTAPPKFADNGQAVQNSKIVDLGLSSGTKWAGWNIGSVNPEDYGEYYAWGETAPKTHYTWGNYFDTKTVNGDMVTFKVYSLGKKTSVVGTDFDVAKAKWGNDWRIPTKEQIDELLRECEWDWTRLNGVYGCTVKGPNGNSIFLPAAGCYFYSNGKGKKLFAAGNTCYYWCGELDRNWGGVRASCLIMSENYPKYYDRNGDRCDGKSVRAVYVGK